LTFTGLQGVVSQKIVIFITTDVRTSNPTSFETRRNKDRFEERGRKVNIEKN
jgi:hypothetical protein